ncbi:MAG: SLC13 family permease [Acidobacteria bacterium]|nr:SLC13 family permease [Acidobacteriota bacterium]
MFSLEWVSADVVALGVLLTLVLTGLLPAEQAFAGFGSDTVILILGLLILTAALMRTGVVEVVVRAILRYTGEDPNRLLVVVMMASATLGAFVSNTASTAFFLPIVAGIARRTRVSSSKLLLPLAFSSILTSSVTLISTSTNILVSGLMVGNGLEPLGMFELAPVGIPIAVIGLVYMMTLGRRLMPAGRGEQDLTEEFGLRSYLSEILILPNSAWVGKTLKQSGLGRDLDLTVLRIIRDKNQNLAPSANVGLQPGDVLLVEGQSEDILKIKDTAGIEIKADAKLSDPELGTEDVGLVEAILLPPSPLIGTTLKAHRFRERYGLQVLAINRHGEAIRSKISRLRLRMGDVLLVQGARARIAALKGDIFRILGAVEETRPNLRRAPIAVLVFAAAVAVGTLKLLPLPVAILLGALATFLTGCIRPEEAYREVDWKVLILVGSMLGLAGAMEQTGTAKFLASQIANWTGHSGPGPLLTGFFALTVLLTQPMSNQAAAAVIVPVAIETARHLGFNPRAFAVMVALGASCSYLTPLEPSCLMVYGPGHYRFIDFLKVGLVLTILIYFVSIILVPKIWPV